MKALVLAAGRGTRIRSVHGERPKCLIQVGPDASTILDHQIGGLLSAGITQIGIVVGYERDQIIQHVLENYRGDVAEFRFIDNPAFAETNNIYSLWLARDWLGGESFVCLNADVICDHRSLQQAVKSPAPINMIVDPEWRDETMKVVIAGNQVIRMSKQIPRSEFSGTYIGITIFSARIQKRLFARIAHLIQTGHEKEFFNVAVQQLADEGVHVGFTSTFDLPWAEIDDPGDLAFAKQHVFPRLIPLPVAA
jgi:L-glutamine-phosphate cytidylyltransferase